MAPFLLYLLKANVVLAGLVGLYYGLLHRLTFFGLNQAYLLLAGAWAVGYPALPALAVLPVATPASWSPWAHVAETTRPLVLPAGGAGDWLLVICWVYGLGVGWQLLRLLGQLGALARVHRLSRPAWARGQPVRQLAEPGGPFSFGATVYLSAAVLADPAALAAVLPHEQAHVRQWHTVDVLLSHVLVALAWPNPAAWLLRRAVRDNLEYLADRAVVDAGLDRCAYQYSLLRLGSAPVPAPALAFHLFPFTLKNRILMLNQPRSSPRHLGRYALAAALVAVLALRFSGSHAQTTPTAKQTAEQAATAAHAQKQADEQAATAAHTQKLADEQAATAAHAKKVANEKAAAGRKGNKR